jgi:hypothetical protein
MSRFSFSRILAGIALSLPLLGQAASLPDDLPPEIKLQQKGNGWKLVWMPTTATPDSVYEGPRAPLPPEPGVPAGYAPIFIIDNAQGLQEAPIPARFKQDLAGDFAATESLSKKKNDLRTLTNEPPSGSGLFLHKGVMEAIDNNTVESKYGAFNNGVLPMEGKGAGRADFFCSTRWYGKDISGNVNLSNQNPAKIVNLNEGGVKIKVDTSFPLAGKANYKINYSVKALSCLPFIPFGLRFDQARAWGEISMDNSRLGLQGSLEVEKKFESDPTSLLRLSKTFFIGPVPVVLGFTVPYYYGFEAKAKIGGSFSIGSNMSGKYVFDYTCTTRGCNGVNSSNIQFAPLNSGERRDASVRVDARPYVGIEALVYLYHEKILTAGPGLQASLPSTYWMYYGNNCADADGDGQAENLVSNVLDVNGRLSLYLRWRALWKDGRKFMDLPKLPGWMSRLEDLNKSGKNDIAVLQRNFYFREFSNPQNSSLTPMILGTKTVPQTGSGYAFKMRPCFPFSDKVEYSIDWGDGRTEIFTGNPDQAVFMKHRWTQPGNKTLILRALKDDSGRPLNFITASQIQVERVPAPGTPDLGALIHSPRGQLVLNWKQPAGFTEYYEVEMQFNNGAWSSYRNLPGNTLATGALAQGLYNFRVRACNISGCGNYSQEQSFAIPLYIAPPVVTLSQNDSCLTEVMLNWPAVPGANFYRILSAKRGDALTIRSQTSDLYATVALLRQANYIPNQIFAVQACADQNKCSAYSQERSFGGGYAFECLHKTKR